MSRYILFLDYTSKTKNSKSQRTRARAKEREGEMEGNNDCDVFFVSRISLVISFPRSFVDLLRFRLPLTKDE